MLTIGCCANNCQDPCDCGNTVGCGTIFMYRYLAMGLDIAWARDSTIDLATLFPQDLGDVTLEDVTQISVDWGDGSPVETILTSGDVFTHSYPVAGNYTITFVVTYMNGLTTTATMNITSNGLGPAAFPTLQNGDEIPTSFYWNVTRTSGVVNITNCPDVEVNMRSKWGTPVSPIVYGVNGTALGSTIPLLVNDPMTPDDFDATVTGVSNVMDIPISYEYLSSGVVVATADARVVTTCTFLV